MRLRTLCLAAALPLAAACSHANKNVKAEEPAGQAMQAAAAPAAVPPATAPAPAVSSAPEKPCMDDFECGAKQLCLSSTCADITPGLAECRVSAHFDFDRASLDPTDLSRLRRAARCLNALPPEETLVEGNCDERGTAQYNVALGFRRAHAVSKYLEDLGVPSSELSEVSYGKELPACTRHTEACWAMNRRADIDRGGEVKDVAALIRADERHEREASAKTVKQAHAAQARRPSAPAHPAAEAPHASAP